MKLSVSYKMTLTRSWGNETLALGNKIQSVQKWLRAENGYDLATAVPAFNYILLRGIYRITFDLCDMGKKSFTLVRESSKMEQILNFQVPAEGLELVILLHTQY